MPVPKGAIYLDPNDPFDKLIIPLVQTERKKRADYADSDDFVANLRRVPDMLRLPGYGPVEDALSMVARKLARVVNLRGRSARNESMADSIDDLVTYALFAKHLMLEDDGQELE